MGAGRKRRTCHLPEKSQASSKANASAPARNLRKSELGAVIFGCKNNTIDECYAKQLFGLPSVHFSYVKNITPGLTLFLFNYSDRKLHGIFEAIGPGQMNINSHGWVHDSMGSTPFPAQVQVRLQRRCCTLTEDQFKPIIADNYYKAKLFWFELDQDQTSKLISLFISLPYNEDSCHSKNSYSLPTSDAKLAASYTRSSVLEANCITSGHTNAQWSSWDDPVVSRERYSFENSVGTEVEDVNQNANCQLSYASVLNNKGIVSDSTVSVPQKKWSSLFKTPSDSDNVKKDKDSRTWASESDYATDWKASPVAPYQETENLESIWEQHSPVTFTDGSIPKTTSLSETLIGETKYEDGYLETIRSAMSNMELASSCFSSHVDGEAYSEDSSDQEKPDSVSSSSSSEIDEIMPEDNHEKDTSHPSFASGVHLESGCSPVADILSETNSCDIQSLVVKLIGEIDMMKGSQLKQIMKITSLEKVLLESKVQIQQLRDRCDVLESGAVSDAEQVGGEYGRLGSSLTDSSILIVGGFNGSSWLSALDSYAPSHDIMTSLCGMTFVQSYASAAKLNNELFIFGGVDDDVWYDTVESYNLASDQWETRPSLNTKKGSLAGTVLHEKIFAIGGRNGIDCFSEVEIFDPNLGRWIFTKSMLFKRVSHAVAEINNSLYVIGGYDGRNYLSSVERFDPRVHSWTGIGSMRERRGCYSVVALNEKLYVLGGFDGSNMVSSVEIFDPRKGSWMAGEPMDIPKGYSGAVVIGEQIYIIGGMKDKNRAISDTIEIYKDGYGWGVTHLKAVGKRCFFSALVL